MFGHRNIHFEDGELRTVRRSCFCHNAKTYCFLAWQPIGLAKGCYVSGENEQRGALYTPLSNSPPQGGEGSSRQISRAESRLQFWKEPIGALSPLVGESWREG
ncbi:hypothetical protein KL86PLE_70104 [uncultured Pleomorphomonas sp.]|uniref:Uncharacterized protein n=1 Tax=uncultured Pleomorphomonas sp. TaxID=442121 RepID=A0A212LL97_9HYPH|nr:hypothetical protein KL86PLE_70104 [uncultured Pleomorphomonas sp.]